jgi:hypothetical protein
MIYMATFFGHYAEYNMDVQFLYNRAYQMYDCIIHGEVPFFYYNDNIGTGYGSAFFYGQLTLYPFLIFVKFGLRPFIQAYSTVTILLTYIGARELSKRFTVNYELAAILYTASAYVLYSIDYIYLYANALGIAISLFFIAKCIDFFRDSKSSLPASVLFFLVLNTHTISALFSFIVCVVIMIMYFDKRKFKEYAKFALVTIVICSYFIINMIYHTNSSIQQNQRDISLSLTSEGSKQSYKVSSRIFLSVIDSIFATIVLRLNTVSLKGMTVLNTFTTLLIIYTIIRNIKKLTKRQVVCILLSITGLVLSISSIWDSLSQKIYNPIQYPRYIYYIILALIIITCIHIRKDKITKILKVIALTCCLMDTILFGFTNIDAFDATQEFQLGWEESNGDYISNQLMSGEYLQSNFDWTPETIQYYSSHVTDQNVNEYTYTKDTPYGSITVNNITTNNAELKLIFPKLYYKGYTAYDENGNSYEITDGYSQYCEVTIPPNTNIQSLTIIYNHPIWLRIWDLACLTLTILITIIYIKERKDKNERKIQ